MKGDAPDWWGEIPSVPTGLTEDRYVAALEIKEVNDVDAHSGLNRATVGGNMARQVSRKRIGEEEAQPSEEAPPRERLLPELHGSSLSRQGMLHPWLEHGETICSASWPTSRSG